MFPKLSIAIVEDHDALREVMVTHVEHMGHAVFSADCADALNELLASKVFDLLILDLNLPGEDGLSIARRLRKAYPEIFIIIMTARNTEKDRIVGYEQGADIYLPKTTSLRELEAAVTSLARRYGNKTAGLSDVIKLDTQKRLLIGKSKVDLGKGELIILKALVESADHRLEYWRLLEVLGKEVNELTKANLEVQVVRLRKKLILIGMEQPAIKALHKEGYQLIEKVEILN